jgi:hypothetical protein
MKIKTSFFLAVLFSSSFALAQSNADVDVTTVVRASLLTPGVSVEARTGNLQTLYLKGFAKPSVILEIISGPGEGTQVNSDFYIDPALALQYRFYYNARKRTEKGKPTAFNSMNFIAPMTQVWYSKYPISFFALDEEKRRGIYELGVVWGMQRNSSDKRFSLDLSLGPGVLYTTETSAPLGTGQTEPQGRLRMSMMGEFSIGFRLNN